jgi:DNA-binding NarL/FixJ family response regulator
MATSILVAEPLGVVRDGLLRILAAMPDIEVVAEAGDGSTAVELAERGRPDVAIVDAQLSRVAGREVIRKLREVSPGTRCILLSADATAFDVREALRCGALAFVPKSGSGAELLEAVRCARKGRPFLAPSITEQVLACVQGEGASPDSALTRRQRDVLELIAEGLSAKQIAGELGISVGTAKTHRVALMRRLGVRKTSALVRIAIREGMVRP